VIVNYRDERLSATRPADPADLAATIDVLLADNRFPDFVLPICRAAHARGIPVVLDVDGPSDATADLLGVASHVLFSAEGLRAAAGSDDLAAGLALMGAASKAFLAVTDGGNDMLWFADGKICRTAPFAIEAVDTLAAGDVFHGAFALALADSGDPVAAMRFAAAVAAVKCTRFGGVSGAPHRRDIEAFLGRPTRT
jgi:sulfofructose kinase